MLLRAWRTFIPVVLGVPAACFDASAPPPPSYQIDQVMFEARASTEAVVLAVGDTQRISVAALNLYGESLPLTDSTTVTWRSFDLTKVTVDPTGAIVGIAATARAVVLVSATIVRDGVSRTDTVSVSVTGTRHPIAKIRVMPYDSTRRGNISSHGYPRVWVRAETSGGDSVLSVYPPVQANGRILVTARGTAFGDDRLVYEIRNRLSVIGLFWVHTQAIVYGVPLRDSLAFTGLYPGRARFIFTGSLANTPQIQMNRSDEHWEAQVCAQTQVIFQGDASFPQRVDVIIEGPAQTTPCAGGGSDNVMNLKTGMTVTRYFRTPGTYTLKAYYAGTTNPIPGLVTKITVKDVTE